MNELPSYVVKVSYHPDPIADDMVTIGIVAFSHNGIRFRFLREWRLLREFGREPVDYIQRWMRRFDQRLRGSSLMVEARPDDLEYFRRLYRETQLNAIQFSEPHPVFLELDKAFDLYSDRFLRLDQPIVESASVDEFEERTTKTDVVEKGRLALSDVLIRRLNTPEAGKLVQKRFISQGSVTHQFDLAVARTRALAGAFVVSFDRRSGIHEISTERNSALFGIEDLRKRGSSIPISIVAVLPSEQAGLADARRQLLYRELVTASERVGFSLYDENRLDSWADNTTSRIPDEELFRALEP